MREILSFDDVMLVPKHSDIISRSLVDISTELRTNSERKLTLQIPIVSSPMDTVSESEMIFRLWRLGGLGIFHRYNSIKQQEELVNIALEKHADLIQNCSEEEVSYISETMPDFLFGGAVGVTGDFIERTQMLVNRGASLICIDVAHGHHENVKIALEKLRKAVDLCRLHVMVGNVGPAAGFKFLAETGLVNSVRCGLSGGSICSTYMATGFGYPTLQSILDAMAVRVDHGDRLRCNSGDKYSVEYYRTQICADGGIKGAKDVSISIAAGADFVMLGSVLAGTKATPGDKIQKDGREWKQYRGGASYESQKARGIEKPRVEGVSALVPFKGKLENVLNPIKDGLESGFSYAGAINIHNFRKYVEIVKITNAGYIQGTPHALRNS